MTIFIKPLRPKKLAPDISAIYYASMRSSIQEFATGVIADYYKIKRTWSNRPEHKSIIDCTPQTKDVAVAFGVTGDEDAVNHWKFLNEGTKVRHAVMSKDWKSKSSYMHIGASQGQGRMVIVNKKINLPGIKARKFDEAISERWSPRWKNVILKAMKQARAKSGL
jgi:hypothetical protein